MNTRSETEVINRPMFIEGVWCGASDEGQLDVIDPATEATIAYVPHATTEDVDYAVKAARRALTNPSWRDMKPLAREALLHQLANLLEENADELAKLETQDNGKPISLSSQVDIPFAISIFRYMAGWSSKLEGASIPISFPGSEFHSYSIREPIGVVGQIIPWNFPLVMAAMKLAPALAAGCTVVLKPAEQTPLTALKLAELIEQAGFPPGVVNVITGPGETTGAAMVDHPGIDKIAFTGSTAVGKMIAAEAAKTVKRVSLELGGKSPAVVFSDADFDLAIPGAAEAIFLNSGQVCFAGSRLYVESKSFDKVVAGVADLASQFKLGPGCEPDTQIGPIISARQINRIDQLLQQGVSQGAEILTGGKRHGKQGYFMEPTVVAGAAPDNALLREEIFGPVLTVLPIDDLAAIPTLANDTTYGLAASIWTQDISRAHSLARQINAGTVWINCHGVIDPALPFGGMKQSGYGRENGRHALDLYTELKTVCVRI